MGGILLINKPIGPTSHDVIYQVRRVTGERKVGHAGTLDPNASGLLLVAVGREFTKKLGVLTTGTKKGYLAQITLGKTSSTDDSEGEISEASSVKPTLSEIRKTIEKFTGEIEQIPPIYSAIKLEGRKAYDLARRGKEVTLKPRKATIYEIENIKYNYPTLEFSCVVSAGTYIRALARDIGESLSTGAYLSALCRSRIGEYKLENAVELSALTTDNWKEYLV